MRSYFDRMERSKMLRSDVSRITRPTIASTASVSPKFSRARLGLAVIGRLPETVGSTVRNGVDGAKEEAVEHAEQVDAGRVDEVTEQPGDRLEQKAERIGEGVADVGDAMDDGRHLSARRRGCWR